MSQQRTRLTITLDEEMDDQVEEVQEFEGYENRTDAGRELLERGWDDWNKEHTEYPGSGLVTEAIRLAAWGFLLTSFAVLGLGTLQRTVAAKTALDGAVWFAVPLLVLICVHYFGLAVADRNDLVTESADSEMGDEDATAATEG